MLRIGGGVARTDRLTQVQRYISARSGAVTQSGLDKEMISRFQALQAMNKVDRQTVLSLIDAFIAKNRIEQILK